MATKEVRPEMNDGETVKKTKQRILSDGTLNNAMAIDAVAILDNMDITEYLSVLNNNRDKVLRHDTSDLQVMLSSQAQALDALFSNMIVRSANNLNKHVIAAEKYMRLALKAQSQCRTTVEALHEIQNPRPYIQHNKAINQQVNNGTVRGAVDTEAHKYAQARTHAKDENKSNELLDNSSMEVIQNRQLEHSSHEQQWMDTRAAQEAGRNDKAMATVDT